MKYTITVECEDKFERDAIIDAVANKVKLDSIYDEVFRPVIKYSEDDEESLAFQKVWEKLNDYLNN